MTESQNQQEKAYNVKDKRRVTLDENGQVQEKAADTENQPEEAAQSHPHEEVPEVDVYSMLSYFIGMLGAQVWQWLGLMKSPSGELSKDLTQAKIAIDSIAALSDQLKDRLSPKEQQELQDMLANMRINFVQQSAKE